MKISYNWLQSFFKKKLPAPEKLANLLTMHSFETELVSQLDRDYLLDVSISPNRAHDCLSHLGIAQEIAAILKYPFEPIDYSKKLKVKKGESVKNLCPRYTAGALINVKVKSSPQWLKERLKICGLRPINNIVDIANYVMLETGQPLHAFDADRLTTVIASEAKQSRGKTASATGLPRGSAPRNDIKTIIVRRAKKREKMITLDDEKYVLDENILVIADIKNPVCIAGVKGGKGPGIDNQTKRVILEAANFSPQIIRQGSQQLKLKTDASWRFEHELDPNLTKQAIDMAAYLIQEMAQGEMLEGIVDVYPKEVKPKKINLDTSRVKSLLGIDIPVKEIKGILERLGLKIQNPKPKILYVTIPTRRLDVSMPEDLIEEVGRLYGFEKIPSQLPAATLVPPERNEELIYQNKIRDILVNLGFSEVYNYSFIGEKEANLYQSKPALIEVANPVSQEQKYLRPSLILNLLNNVRENKKYFEEIRLFEIGKVFQKVPRAKGKEEEKLAGIISLESKSNQDEKAPEFYRLKGIIDSVLNQLRISDIWYDDALGKSSPVPDFCHSVRRAEIKIADDCLGWLGEIDIKVLAEMGIDYRLAGFELNFKKLVALATEERIYSPPSRYPAMVRDIALLVDIGIKVEEVLNLIHAAGGPLIKDIDLFDIYLGEEIPQGKKNLAFHIIYQADDRTLTDKEVNQLQEKIIKALEEEGGWEVRK